MRLLILSDIHGNIDALDAIDEPWDHLFALGDLVDYGAAPEQAVQWIRDRKALAITGNHDYAMATGADCRSAPISYALSVATREHFRPLLSVDAMSYLREIPHKRRLTLAGADFHLVHATPRDLLFEYLSGDATEANWCAAVGALAELEAWLFVGHTHLPFLRRIDRLTIVNPGSLGMPVDGDPRACYAIWEDGDLQLKRVRYDVEKAIGRLKTSGLSPGVVDQLSCVLRYAGRSG